ncbi:protein with putative role during mitosis [Orbilia oligospora]|uniref:Nuclear distribution protein PAC1 n=1 Tax=Orbilia oligospora TaxID=2813651 RepID=A0A7C8PA09_ORBOL|nr:protein with putative role during mitosis [Orbilia oligospora]
MAELKTATQTLDFDDEIALHLLVETAIFDSSGYELLTHEELDRLKREQTTLIGRIEALRRKLLLETKVRDAAQSLSRLRSPKQNESPLTSPVNAFGGSFHRPGHDSVAQASVELSASIAKCHEIDTDIRKLEADLWVLQRRLLRHTSRVLATTYHHAEKSRHFTASSIDVPTIRSSTPNKSTKLQTVKPVEDFDDRSLYKPAISSGEAPPSQSQFRTSGPLTYATDPGALPAHSGDPMGLKPQSSIRNMEAIGLFSTPSTPPPLDNRDKSAVEQRLVALHHIVKEILVKIEILPPYQHDVGKSLFLEERKDSFDSTDEIPTSTLDEIAALEHGLRQVQASIFQPGRIMTGTAREAKRPDSIKFEALKSDGKSIGELVEGVKLLADTSLRWAADKRDLEHQLLQKSQHYQMEIRKHEDTKTDHEQQIDGLTNSLSKALSELSQISSKQDPSISLRQEMVKLREELDTKEQHCAHKIGELQLMLGSQKSDFENLANDARIIFQERERDLEEQVDKLREEVMSKNKALEDSLACASTGDQKTRKLNEEIDYLRIQLEKSHAAKVDVENQLLLDKHNLESLTETLHTHEARVEILERKLMEAIASKEKSEETYHEQTKRIEILDKRNLDLQDQLRVKATQVAEQTSSVEEFKSRLIESQTAKKNLESNVSTLENEVQQLLTELATLANDLQATKTNSQLQIEEAKQQAAAMIQVEQGRSQPAMDANLIVELENLSRQNEELRKANIALQSKLSESATPLGGTSPDTPRALQERCDKLQKELDEMLVDYEALMKDSVDFEADKSRLESQIDDLQEKVEALERSLADERMGNGRSVKSTAVSANNLVTPTPSSGENMTMSVLRAEFKKMMRDMRTEHNRALRTAIRRLPSTPILGLSLRNLRLLKPRTSVHLRSVMSGSALTDRQRDELNKSIAAYLQQSGYLKSVQMFREEVDGENELLSDDVCKKYEGLLEKKWTSVVRLQKKIMDLESRIQTLQNELDLSATTSSSQKKVDPKSWLPRAPARHTLTGHRDPINAIAFHPVFSVVASAAEDATIKVWDWEHGELEQTLKGHTKAVLDLDYGGPKTGVLLASCSHDLTIKLWDPGNEYNCIRTMKGHDHSVSSVRFIPSGSGADFLVSASRDRTLKIWDVSTGYAVKTIQGHVDWVRCVEPSLDGKWMASAGNDQTARIWDTSTNDHKTSLIGHTHVIECIAFAPVAAYPTLSNLAGVKKPPSSTSFNEYLATGSRDKTINLWDSRGTLIKTLTGHDNWVKGIVFHPSGRYLLSCSDDKTIRCWDLSQNGRCVKIIEPAHGHFVTCIKWAPNQTRGGIDGAANGAPSVESPRQNGTPPKIQSELSEMSGIRCVVATGSVDLTVKIWAT